MCMWFGFNPKVNFCHFSALLTLTFFAGMTSTSPKFDLFFFCGGLNLWTNDYLIKAFLLVFTMTYCVNRVLPF